MKTFLAVLCIAFIGCGSPDHNKEREEVCAHSEGFAADQCNAGDDFSPDTCESALNRFEGWWRGDAQTAVNECIKSSACNNQADGVPGPSIQMPLQVCLTKELAASLKPTDAQNQAVSKFCVKASACKELDNYTIVGCEQVLLDPYTDGVLFLIMNDQVAANVGKCDQAACSDFDACVLSAFQTVGAFDSIMNTSIKAPTLMRTK